ncbi:glycosyltransferase family 4 protein [Thioalkalivibrio sp. ALJ7]|uniref:glycosyltransferase family 4 protein n=1 Tax=Thioalkalivibrio sp. ALJ7 TaxID=1158756 RepID=UPI00036A6A73|nr:glycosyltransferase family 4 protein [Thioalkalivibrio sp. ALJ7]
MGSALDENTQEPSSDPGPRAVQVGYVVSTLRRSGPTRQLLNLVTQLNRWGYGVHVLTLSSEPDDSLWREFEALGVRLSTLSMGRGVSMLAGKRKIKAWAEQSRVDVLHTQGIRADSMVCTLGIPHVATLRNYPFEDYPLLYGRWRGWCMAHWHMRALRRVSRPVVVSWGVAEMLKRHGLEMDVIQNGVDVEYFDVPAGRAAAKQAVGHFGEQPLVVATGHLIDRKDPETALRAMTALENKVKFVLVGDGALRPELERRWGANDQVRFVGRVEDVRPWLQAADVFVSPSKSEGLPNSVMEAMACGLPCVLSDIPPHRELLEDQPSAGELFTVGDAEGMAQAVLRVLENTEAAGAAARDNAVMSFSSEVMAGGYLKLYQQESKRTSRRVGH